mgnify:CR=1 FL=1|tara:strand:+ start:126 stop:464 length:339 start_codon:yes stop_codon:yes gene_type:complete
MKNNNELDFSLLVFNDEGLIPIITQEALSGKVLMLAWMSQQTIKLTLATKKLTYWSRSRNKNWIKGETSGHTQRLISLWLDCDQDCLLASVEQIGPACHTNNKTCFFTEITL